MSPVVGLVGVDVPTVIFAAPVKNPDGELITGLVSVLLVMVCVSESPTIFPVGAVTAETTPEASFAIPVSPVGNVTVPVKVGEARGALSPKAVFKSVWSDRVPVIEPQTLEPPPEFLIIAGGVLILPIMIPPMLLLFLQVHQLFRKAQLYQDQMTGYIVLYQ